MYLESQLLANAPILHFKLPNLYTSQRGLDALDGHMKYKEESSGGRYARAGDLLCTGASAACPRGKECKCAPGAPKASAFILAGRRCPSHASATSVVHTTDARHHTASRTRTTSRGFAGVPARAAWGGCYELFARAPRVLARGISAALARTRTRAHTRSDEEREKRGRRTLYIHTTPTSTRLRLAPHVRIPAIAPNDACAEWKAELVQEGGTDVASCTRADEVEAANDGGADVSKERRARGRQGHTEKCADYRCRAAGKS
ncbi:hypothetical protein FB451DRAFT_1481045 [Mycena latifolia]|nr:hypothetical protein FB451DRAFT_1481045 [Mycena latifolia]